MEDEITINLRALSEFDRVQLEVILAENERLVGDEENIEALKILREFKEE